MFYVRITNCTQSTTENWGSVVGVLMKVQTGRLRYHGSILSMEKVLFSSEKCVVICIAILERNEIKTFKMLELLQQ
jgi:hypothetical protein